MSNDRNFDIKSRLIEPSGLDPRREAVIRKADAFVYSGPPDRDMCMPGILLGTSDRGIAPYDGEENLEGSFALGISNPKVAIQIVSAALMAILDEEQLDEVMYDIVDLMKHNILEGVESVIHGEIRASHVLYEATRGTDVDNLLNQMNAEEEGEDK